MSYKQFNFFHETIYTMLDFFFIKVKQKENNYYNLFILEKYDFNFIFFLIALISS